MRVTFMSLFRKKHINKIEKHKVSKKKVRVKTINKIAKPSKYLKEIQSKEELSSIDFYLINGSKPRKNRNSPVFFGSPYFAMISYNTPTEKSIKKYLFLSIAEISSKCPVIVWQNSEKNLFTTRSFCAMMYAVKIGIFPKIPQKTLVKVQIFRFFGFENFVVFYQPLFIL